MTSSDLVGNHSQLCGEDLAVREVFLGLLPNKNTSFPLLKGQSMLLLLGRHLLGADVLGVMGKDGRAWPPSLSLRSLPWVSSTQ